MQTGRGDDRYAGWSLLVAYQDASQDVHRVSVYDGLGTVQNGTPSPRTSRRSSRPSSGTVDTRVGMLAFEGDAGIAVGESQTFNGSSLVDAQNPVDNPLNSTVSINGTAFTAKNPNYSNLMGIDIDVSDRTGLLAHHQSSAVALLRVRPGPVRARPRCGSSPTRARPSTPPARRSAASPATARR